MQDVVIDVGANQGGFALEVAARNPELQVISFEPIPQLSEQIVALARARELFNVVVLPMAIDAAERTAVFHVADHADLGVSSLLELDHVRIARDEYWSTRQDLYFDSTIDVAVTRLDSVPTVIHAGRIRFIKIDAQGVDLAVLESLGAQLGRVDAGMLEVPATRDSRLYANEAHDLQSATLRLIELGFRIYAIKPNDHASNEFNVYFCRPDVDHQEVERALQLRGIQLYDGKHFWHEPSDTFLADASLAEAQRVLDRLTVVEAALDRECAETRRLNAAVAIRDTQLRQLQQLLAQLR